MGNPFAELLNDTVFIQASDGSRSGPYKTAIGSEKGRGLSATIFDGALNVEEGWKLIRPLPNGREEMYTVLETNYSPGLSGIPPHWNLQLQKEFVGAVPEGGTEHHDQHHKLAGVPDR